VTTPRFGAALWSLWSLLAAWATVRVCGLERHGLPLVQLVAFTPYVAAASVPVMVAAVVVRRWWLAGAAAVIALAFAACLLPRAIPDPGPVGGGPRLRVLTTNMWTGDADPVVILGLVHALDIDVLAVQELTTVGQSALDAAGLGDVLAHRASYLEPHISGLFSRFPMRDRGLRLLGSEFGQARATLDVPGAPPVEVESVHSCAPVGEVARRRWAADLAEQPPAPADGPIRVLLGDFNATLDHAPMRHLLGTGYRDAADVRGAGLAPTWPVTGMLVPGVTIDHVLADRRVGVTAYRVFAVPGTDHRAVYAELVLPAARAV
jgi:endonuclease/exonuclease/phosphatase (EEP) superfamily protein YafD